MDADTNQSAIDIDYHAKLPSAQGFMRIEKNTIEDVKQVVLRGSCFLATDRECEFPGLKESQRIELYAQIAGRVWDALIYPAVEEFLSFETERNRDLRIVLSRPYNHEQHSIIADCDQRIVLHNQFPPMPLAAEGARLRAGQIEDMRGRIHFMLFNKRDEMSPLEWGCLLDRVPTPAVVASAKAATFEISLDLVSMIDGLHHFTANEVGLQRAAWKRQCTKDPDNASSYRPGYDYAGLRKALPVAQL